MRMIPWFPYALETTAQAWDALLSNLKHHAPQLNRSDDTNPDDTNPAKPQPGFGIVTRNEEFLPVHVLQEKDAEELKTFLDGLSTDAKYTRFHRAMGDTIPFRVAQYLARRDGTERVALVATHQTRIVAMVEYAVPREDNELPEVAYVVADAWQGKGIASQMLSILGVLSYAGGHTQWYASILADNTPAVRLLSHVGTPTLTKTSMGVADYTITLDPDKLFT